MSHYFCLWNFWRDLTVIVWRKKQKILQSPVAKERVIFLYERGKKRLSAAMAALFTMVSLMVPVEAGEVRTVIPLGKAVGIKLFADGALVVAVEDSHVLQKGDLLLRLGGEAVSSTEEVQAILAENGGAAMTMEVRRGTELLSLSDTPRQGADGVWRLGVWVRDSMAGVGTLTYYDPEANTYGALGHGIADVDTAQLMTLHSGAIMPTTVKAVKKGVKGDPGELKGDFSVQRDVGTLTANTGCGIFGAAADADFFTEGTALPVASAEDIVCGEATILCTVSGDETRAYTVEIKKCYQDGHEGRDMLLQVTDAALLSTTGGIVQGMSGSPIIQNGTLIGAVTHVLVNDPTSGYGIFIENMLNAG